MVSRIEIVLALVAIISAGAAPAPSALRRAVAAEAIQPPSPQGASAANATPVQYGSPSSDPMYGTMHSTMGEIESDGVPKLSVTDPDATTIKQQLPPASIIEEAKDVPVAVTPNPEPSRRALRGVQA